jgi:membrane protein
VAFYAFLAIFPSLIAVVMLYGLIADPAQIESHLASLGSVLPPEAADMVLSQLHDLVQSDDQTLGVSAIGAIALALWSASSGVRTLMEALNVTYKEDERRGFFSYYGTALLLTFGAVLGALSAVAIVVAVPVVLNFIGLGSTLEGLITYARWPIIAGGMLIGLAVMYRYGPSRDKPRWAWASPGAIIATLLWLVASALFSFYVTRFGNYNETYGAIGAVVILMMWFYLTAYISLIGAEINAEIERQTLKDTTEGRPKPMGQRGAYAADTVGESA